MRCVYSNESHGINVNFDSDVDAFEDFNKNMDNTDTVYVNGASTSAASESLEFGGKTLFVDSELPGSKATKFQWIEFHVQSAGLSTNFLDSILNHTIKRQMLKLIQMRQPPTETSRGRNPTDGNSTQYQKKRQRFLRQASKWISRTSPQRDSVCVTTIGDKNKVLSTSECAGEPSSSDRKSL